MITVLSCVLLYYGGIMTKYIRYILPLCVMLIGAASFWFQWQQEEVFIDEDIPMANPVVLDDDTLEAIDEIRDIEVRLSVLLDEPTNGILNQGVLNIIRSKRYGCRSGGLEGALWDGYAGNMSKEVGVSIEAVAEVDKDILGIADGLSYIHDPSDGSIIDVPHMVAVIDVLLTDLPIEDDQEIYSDIILTWGGDLESFLVNMENDNSDKVGVDEAQLYEYATSTMGSAKASYFSVEDFYADLDGVNIYQIMERDDLLLSDAIHHYYSSGDYKEREALFVAFYGGDRLIRKLVYDYMEVDSVDYQLYEASAKGDYLNSVYTFKSMMLKMKYGYDNEVDGAVRRIVSDVFLEKLGVMTGIEGGE